MKSSSPDSSKTLRLTVNAWHRATILTVMDHGWRVVASGIGHLSADLPAGIYKVEARLSRDSWSGYASLRDEPKQVDVPAIGIKSAAPHHEFTRSHEYHEAELEAALHRTDVVAGGGARILMMARNWSPDQSVSVHPPRLRLERWRGDTLADLNTDGHNKPGKDAVGTCAVEANPGAYVVSVETPFGGFSQSIYARPGWETRVFVLQDFATERTSAASADARPTISVTQAMARPGESNPRLYDLLEAGQAALAERRLALGSDVFDEIAWGKWEAPNLGLIAAHILLMADDPVRAARSDAPLVQFDRPLYETIIRNTAKFLGERQPDVLALRTRSHEMPVPNGIKVRTPPLYVRSWDLLMEANKSDHPELVPGSLWRRVRGNTNSAPYFTWTRAEGVIAAQKRASERRLVEGLVKAASSMTDDAAQSPAKFSLDSASPDDMSVRKPNLADLASYAPRLDPRQLVIDTDSFEGALKQIARYANLPYTVAESLLDHEDVRRLFSSIEK